MSRGSLRLWLQPTSSSLRSTNLRSACLASASLAALAVLALAGQAAAQDDTSDKTKDKAKAPAEVVVTATGTNISNVKPVGSEAVALDRKQILDTGRLTVADVVRTLPQVQSLGFNDTAGATQYGGTTGGAQQANAVSGGNTTRGNQINIRGLPGQNSTLLLIDGRRVAPSGAQTQFQEANQVPLAAVERVEVMADGASAIYGSDAISGVVNFVLRKRFDGLEVTGRYGFNRYGANWDASAVFGHDWDHLGRFGEGNLIVSYEHFHQDPVLRGKIPQLREDLTPFGGDDNRINGGASYNGTPNFGAGTNGGVATAGIQGNIVVPAPGTINQVLPAAQANIYYGIPAGNTGIPTLAQLQALVNHPDLVDRSDFEDYLPRTNRDQVTAFLHQDLTSWLSLFYQGFLTKRHTVTRTFIPSTVQVNSFTVQVNPGTPFYINGLTTPGRPYFVQYNLLAHYEPNGGPFLNDNPENSYTNTLGFDAQLPHDWKGELYYTYGADHSCGVCYLGTFVSPDTPVLLEQDINSGLVNPYSNAPLSKAEVARISGSNIQQGENLFNDAVMKFNGPLFDLPGGTVKVAVGGEYTYTISKVRNGANRPCDQFVLGAGCATADNIFRWDADSRDARQQWSTFGELYVPIVGQGNALPLMQELTLDAAVRYDRYTQFGATTNPKIGATWKVSQDLSLRGSYGTSFRAPSQPDTDPGAFSVAVQIAQFPNLSGNPNIKNDFTIPGFAPFTDVLFRLGGNPSVKPETGRHWSVGFDLTPRFTPGLRVSGTYFNIDYRNRIAGPAALAYLFPGGPTNAYLGAYLTPLTTPAGCNNANPATWNPLLAQALEGNLYGPGTIGFLYGASTIVNPCGIHAIADGRTTNAAGTKQDGIDVSATYTVSTEAGVFTLAGAATKIFHNQTQPFVGQPFSSELGRILFPVSLRGRGNLGWFDGPFSVNLALNYVGSYTNDQPIIRYTTTGQKTDPTSQVPAWTTFDLNVTYTIGGKFSFAPLRQVRASVGIENLFDRNAPIVLTGTEAMDPANANPLGRIWTFQLTKTF